MKIGEIIAALRSKKNAPIEWLAAAKLEQMHDALSELDRSVCLVRESLSADQLAQFDELWRSRLDLALVKARRALSAIPLERGTDP